MEQGVMPADKRRIIEAAAALLAVSVKSAKLFREVKENRVRDLLTGSAATAAKSSRCCCRRRRATGPGVWPRRCARKLPTGPCHGLAKAITVTASFGLAQTLPGEVNVQAVIACADQVLYRAKDDGRNRVWIAAETATLIADDSNWQNRFS